MDLYSFFNSSTSYRVRIALALKGVETTFHGVNRLRPLSGLKNTILSPIGAYRWEHTDRALSEQLRLEDEGYPATVEPGHAAVRYVNPTTGGDIMPTIRAEFHRLAARLRSPLAHALAS